MDSNLFVNSAIFTWVIMPILIFAARICDVTIGTIRIISIGRGDRALSPLLGFFEILIWLLAIRQIMQNLTNVFYYVAYAGGFGAGTFVGMYIEERLAMGILLVRVITKKDASELIRFLKSEGYGVTAVDAEGAEGRVHVIYTIIQRGNLPHVVEIVNRFSPRAFYSVEDIRAVKEGTLPLKRPPYRRNYLGLLRIRKKGK